MTASERKQGRAASRARGTVAAVATAMLIASPLAAAPYYHPVASYIFPAGAQRGTDVELRIGGLFLHDQPHFELVGATTTNGIKAPRTLTRAEEVWFQGPMVTRPVSNGPKDYPVDYAGHAEVDEDVSLGTYYWRLWNAQGVTSAKPFIVGDLPEVVEAEIDGRPLPQEVDLPVTVNGRIYPHEDVDLWSFACKRGRDYSVEVTARLIASPLDARIEVVGPEGRSVAEAIGTRSQDARLHFRAVADGLHTLRIHDIGFAGAQDHVYRMTIVEGATAEWIYPLGGRKGSRVEFVAGDTSTDGSRELYRNAVELPRIDAPAYTYRFRIGEQRSNQVTFQVSDVPETLEHEPNDTVSNAGSLALPGVANGRVDRGKDVDVWAFAATAGSVVRLEIFGHRLGTKLDALLRLTNAAGEEVAAADDTAGTTDAALEFSVPADGTYYAHVRDRYASRGGVEFAYRLNALLRDAPDLVLKFGADAITVDRAGKGGLSIQAERRGGLSGPIALEVEGLPPGVSVTGAEIAADKSQTSLAFSVAADAPLDSSQLRVRGRASHGGFHFSRSAEFRLGGGLGTIDHARLAIGLKTPFALKSEGPYYKRATRGDTQWITFALERGGFDGPLEVRLCDRQRRHLQGARGGVLTIPAGVERFDFPFYLATEMESPRTARVLIQASGVVEVDGKRHVVCYADSERTQGVLNIVAPRLDLQLMHETVVLWPGASATLPFTVLRGPELTVPMRCELILPAHIRGVTAAPVVLPADASRGELRLQAGADAGPFNMPLTIRAAAQHDGDRRTIAEAEFEIVWRAAAPPLTRRPRTENRTPVAGSESK